MIYNGVELSVKDGKVAVLVSPGYGAGWSTWNDDKIAYDKRVVDYYDAHLPKLNKNGLDALEAFMESIGYPNTYTGGYNQIVKEYVPTGVPFFIREYDGSECISAPDSVIVFKDE